MVGRGMHVVPFFCDHQQRFSTLWIIVQCESTKHLVEVGCERYFDLSGYSAPRHTRLGVRTYEHIAMLASILQNAYIDDDWVAHEYLRRSKIGTWKKENTIESQKSWNVESVVEAELLGKDQPQKLTLDE